MRKKKDEEIKTEFSRNPSNAREKREQTKTEAWAPRKSFAGTEITRIYVVCSEMQ